MQRNARLAAELAALRQHGLQVRVVAPGDRRGLRAALTDAVLLWHAPGGAPLAADLFAEAPRLRLVQALGSGAEAIDLAAAKARGIAVCAAPGADTAAVAEMVLALMFACLRRLPALDRASRDRARGRRKAGPPSASSAAARSGWSATAPCRRGSPRR